MGSHWENAFIVFFRLRGCTAESKTGYNIDSICFAPPTDADTCTVSCARGYHIAATKTEVSVDCKKGSEHFDIDNCVESMFLFVLALKLFVVHSGPPPQRLQNIASQVSARCLSDDVNFFSASLHRLTPVTALRDFWSV